MKLTIPKNRVVPLIIYAIVGTIISLIVGMFYMNRTVEKSYDASIHNYDKLSAKTAEVLKQGIEESSKTIEVAAILVGQTGGISKEYTEEILPTLANYSTYDQIYIVNLQGKGYDMSGKSVDFSREKFFELSGKGNTVVACYTQQEKTKKIVYTAPIIKKGRRLGVLVATQKTPTHLLIGTEFEHMENNLMYILDDKNQLVVDVYGDSSEQPFQYGQTIIKGFLHDDYRNHKVDMKLSDYLDSGKTKEDLVVWYQKPLGINHWSVLVGRTNILDPITQNIIRITNIMWFFILTCIMILFLMLIIFQRRSSQKVIQMLYLDPVTGGYNWYKFRIDVNKILKSRLFSKNKYAVINFDINRFKIINDSFGHQKGDEVLREVHNVIKKWARPDEPYTRYSADQFYVLLHYQEVNEVQERIMDLINRLHHLNYTKTVKFYFGVYFVTERKDSIDRMGDFACIAKHKVKGSNEGFISYFDDNARNRILEEELIEKSMYDALKNDEFLVYLQPKYTTTEEKISGAEALVRWSIGNGDLVPPGFFIPVFEKNGFITELDLYMLKKVCKIQKDWIDKGYQPLPVSVNVSRIHFANPHLADIIRNIVEEYKVPHELIEIELSESAFLQNKQVLINTVTLLRKYGFQVSMDDFGAGYSSLNSLKDLPLDVVKLDGEMFRITEEVERGHTVIRNTISMAKDLHMKVVAECIETREQVDFLCQVGCDIIQGYYYAKPMPVEQFESSYLVDMV